MIKFSVSGGGGGGAQHLELACEHAYKHTRISTGDLGANHVVMLS